MVPLLFGSYMVPIGILYDSHMVPIWLPWGSYMDPICFPSSSYMAPVLRASAELAQSDCDDDMLDNIMSVRRLPFNFAVIPTIPTSFLRFLR